MFTADVLYGTMVLTLMSALHPNTGNQKQCMWHYELDLYNVTVSEQTLTLSIPTLINSI